MQSRALLESQGCCRSFKLLQGTVRVHAFLLMLLTCRSQCWVKHTVQKLSGLRTVYSSLVFGTLCKSGLIPLTLHQNYISELHHRNLDNLDLLQIVLLNFCVVSLPGFNIATVAVWDYWCVISHCSMVFTKGFLKCTLWAVKDCTAFLQTAPDHRYWLYLEQECT